MPEPPLLNQLRATVIRLAAPANEQAKYLRAIETLPSADELALEFHDLVISPKRLRSEAGASDELLDLLAKIDKKLSSFSGTSHAEDWEASALARSRNWAEVRELAELALEAMA